MKKIVNEIDVEQNVVKLYVYAVVGNKVVETVCDGVEVRGCYRFRTKSGNRRFLTRDKLDIVVNNSIVSLEDNPDKYRSLLLDYYTKKVEKIKEKLRKEKTVLKMLEEMVKTSRNVEK